MGKFVLTALVYLSLLGAIAGMLRVLAPWQRTRLHAGDSVASVLRAS